MSISFDKALGIHEAALNLRATRAAVLSNNLVNADTPNYKSQDIDFRQAMSQYSSGQRQFQTTSTHASHIAYSPVSKYGGHTLYRTPSQPSLNGNTVEENVEHAEFMKNSLEFQAAFTFLNSKFKGLRKALTGQ